MATSDITILALTVLLILFSKFYGAGHESAIERRIEPLSESEIKLEKQYTHRTAFMSRSRCHDKAVEIFTQQWIPTEEPKDIRAIVVMLHGLNGHGSRLLKQVERLLPNNLLVALIDFEGFGRSSGRHGYFRSFDYTIGDVLHYIEILKAEFPHRPLFLFGPSMGGLILTHTLLNAEEGLIDGAVLQAPAITIHEDTLPPKAVQEVSKFLAKTLPKLPLLKANKGKNCSPEVNEQNEAIALADPLYYSGRLRIGTGMAILQAVADIKGRFSEVRVPFLLQHGEKDRVCAIQGSEMFFEEAQSKDKTFLKYSNAEHDLPNEPKQIADAVSKDYIEWILQRSSEK